MEISGVRFPANWIWIFYLFGGFDLVVNFPFNGSTFSIASLITVNYMNITRSMSVFDRLRPFYDLQSS